MEEVLEGGAMALRLSTALQTPVRMQAYRALQYDPVLSVPYRLLEQTWSLD